MRKTRRTIRGRRCRRSALPMVGNPGSISEFVRKTAKEAMSTAQYSPEVSQDTNPMDGAQTGVGKNEMNIKRENQ